jgi:TIGR00251 family protein
MAINISENNSSVTFDVRVIPRSSKSEIVGEYNGALKVKLNSPPVDGAANDELMHLLSKEFRLSRSTIEIVSGQTARTKRVRILGITAIHILDALKAKS